MTGQPGLTRRQMLGRLGGVAAGAVVGVPAASVLSACGSSGGSASKNVTLFVRTDQVPAFDLNTFVKQWNAKNKTQVKLDVGAATLDPTTKILAAQASGSPNWDGWLPGPYVTPQPFTQHMIQPIDDYVSRSKVANADKVVPGIIPTIKSTLYNNGKLYAIPANCGSNALAAQTDAMKAVGLTTLEGLTWDDIYQASKQLKTARPKLTPFASAYTPLCDLWAMIWGGTKNVFTSDGLVDITGDTSIQALEWMKKMVSEGLMDWNSTDSFNNWQKKGIGIISSYDVAGTVYQKSFGQKAAANGTNLIKTKGDLAGGTPFWTNGCVVLNKAKNPQGLVDFLLWLFGPDNTAMAKQTVQVAAKPCYQYVYDKYIKDDPANKWQLDGIEVIKQSVPYPNNNAQGVENTVTPTYVQKVLDPSSHMDPAKAMQTAISEIKRQLAKNAAGGK